MTNILLISRCPPYPIHLGDRLIIWHLARELSQRDYTLDLLALTQFENDWQTVSEYEQFFHSVELFEESKRSPLLYLQRALLEGRRFPQKASQAWQGNMWRAIEQFLATEKYDLVHLFGGVQVYEFAQLLANIPTIITPYESFSLYLKRVAEQKGSFTTHINRLMARHYENWMYRPYRRTVVLTREDKAELLDINPKLAIEVIPNGIDLTYFSGGQAEREPATLLFIGNYEYEPNLDAAFVLAKQIFPIIQQTITDVRLQLVGYNPPTELQALQSSTIEITGSVPDVRPYLAQATAFVSPLQIGAGIKNKVLEALAMGIPVVASPISIEGIQAKDSEQVLIANIEKMPEKVIHLLQNRRLQKNLSQSGRSLIEAKYSWRSVADRYEVLYRALMK